MLNMPNKYNIDSLLSFCYWLLLDKLYLCFFSNPSCNIICHFNWHIKCHHILFTKYREMDIESQWMCCHVLSESLQVFNCVKTQMHWDKLCSCRCTVIMMFAYIRGDGVTFSITLHKIANLFIYVIKVFQRHGLKAMIFRDEDMFRQQGKQWWGNCWKSTVSFCCNSFV